MDQKNNEDIIIGKLWKNYRMEIIIIGKFIKKITPQLLMDPLNFVLLWFSEKYDFVWKIFDIDKLSLELKHASIYKNLLIYKIKLPIKRCALFYIVKWFCYRKIT
jgi:hypothetical protein